MNKYFGIVIISALLCCKGEELKKPNFLFIFADDLTFQAIGALGNTQVQTPHLDRLFQSGTVFTNAYNMGGWNGAICVASRAMIISGQSIWDAQKTSAKWREKESSQQTWGKLLSNAGYDTYMSGKWHVDLPPDSVFDFVQNVRPGMPPDQWNHTEVMRKRDEGILDFSPFLPTGYHRPESPEDTLWQPFDKNLGGFWSGGKHWSEVVRDDAFEFLNLADESEDPFFMYLAFNAPHDPRQSPMEFLEKYSIEELEIPKNWLPEYPDKDGMGASAWLRDEALAPFPRTEYAIKKHIQEYYAIITHLDEQVGQILDRLENSDLGENTYVIFTADHGLSVGQHGLLGKQNMYDHSLKVPFVISGPGISKGLNIDQPIYLQDVMPTVLELSDVEVPEYVFFKSLLPLLSEKPNYKHYQAIYGAYVDLQRMIKVGSYKLIAYPELSKLKLFDLETDTYEMNNLAADPEYASKLKELFYQLLENQKQYNDPLDLSLYYPEMFETDKIE